MNWSELKLYINKPQRTRAELESVAKNLGLKSEVKGKSLINNLNRRVEAKIREEGLYAKSSFVPRDANGGNNAQRSEPDEPETTTTTNKRRIIFEMRGLIIVGIFFVSLIALIAFLVWAGGDKQRTDEPNHHEQLAVAIREGRVNKIDDILEDHGLSDQEIVAIETSVFELITASNEAGIETAIVARILADHVEGLEGDLNKDSLMGAVDATRGEILSSVTVPTTTAPTQIPSSPTVIPTQTLPTNSDRVVTTKCGPVTWGPAGPVPGAFTNDSPAQVAEAVQVMQVPLEDAAHVTVHKFCPGDDTPNGWIVGSSWTESNGVTVSANFLPAGTCIDYDPNATAVIGDIEHTQELNPKWHRSLLRSDGSASGLKFTVYWTPCIFTDGHPIKEWDGQTTAKPAAQITAPVQAPDTTTTLSCKNLPQSASDLQTVFPNTNPENWAQHPQYPHGWIYNGPQVALTAIEGVHHIDYDGGRAITGEAAPAGTAFTAWFCA